MYAMIDGCPFDHDEMEDGLQTGEVTRDEITDALVAEIHDADKAIRRLELKRDELEKAIAEECNWKRAAIDSYQYFTGEEW